MKKPKPKIDRATLRKLYYNLIKIRRFEEKIVELYPSQNIRCPVHLCMGQEAIAAGICAHLKKEDYLFSNHRNHGHLIAKGADLKPILAELYGKKTGCSEGKGGSMHMVSTEKSILGTSAIVAGGLPIAVGTALASKMKKEKRITVVFFGDGAADEGTFYESLNFASLFKLPVVFICENNFYATNSPQKNRQVNTNIYKIADHFLMPGIRVDGNDILDVWHKSRRFIENTRKGAGPSLIEARTYRYCTHVGPESDIEKGFREKTEVDEWLAKCPRIKFKDYILKKKLLSLNDIKKIDEKVESEIGEALDFAMTSPYPAEVTIKKDVY